MNGIKATAWKAVTRGAVSRGPQLFLNFGKNLLLFTLLLLFCVQYGQSAERTISLLSSQGTTYLNVSDSLSNALSKPGELKIHQLSTDELSSKNEPNATLNRSELIVAIGTKAVRFLTEHHPEATVLAIFTTSYSYNAAIAKLPEDEHKFFGLFIDQPLERYLHLARLLLPEAKTLGATGLMGKDSITTACGFGIETADIEADSNPIRLLDSLFTNSDVFLVLPNSSSTNRNSAKWILYLASRHHKPVIAFSEKYVTGGALAAVYASPDDIVQEADTIIKSWLKTEIPKVPWKKMGEQFTVKTNTGIARYLRLTLAEDAVLEEKLATLDHEHACPAQVNQ